MICFACVSCHVPTCSISPALGKVSKPGRGHPLVDFVFGIGMDCWTNIVKNRGLSDSCIPLHAYGALKGRPWVLRTV